MDHTWQMDDSGWNPHPEQLDLCSSSNMGRIVYNMPKQMEGLMTQGDLMVDCDMEGGMWGVGMGKQRKVGHVDQMTMMMM